MASGKRDSQIKRYTEEHCYTRTKHIRFFTQAEFFLCFVSLTDGLVLAKIWGEESRDTISLS